MVSTGPSGVAAAVHSRIAANATKGAMDAIRHADKFSFADVLNSTNDTYVDLTQFLG